MNIQDEMQKIHHKFGVSEMANYKIEQFVENLIKKDRAEQLILHGVSGSLPDLMECNQAALDYAEKKNNPDFFLVKQVFKDGVNWGLNKVTK